MGRTVTGSPLKKTPIVRFGPKGLPDNPGMIFVGVKMAQKPGRKNDKGETGLIFECVIEKASPALLIQFYDKNTELYTDAPVGPGSEVVIFGDRQLNDKMNGERADGMGVKDGERFMIKYLGKKLNPKTGYKFRDYDVQVLSADEVVEIPGLAAV